jgi:hypothetical protein
VITSASGKLKLEIPPGSLDKSVAMAIVPVDAWPVGALGAVFQILPSGTTFAKQATLTYRYSDGEVGASSPSRLTLAQAVGTKWIAQTSIVDTANQTVTTALAHLSIYGLISVDLDAGSPDNGLPDASSVDPIPDAGRTEAGKGGSGGAGLGGFGGGAAGASNAGGFGGASASDGGNGGAFDSGGNLGGGGMGGVVLSDAGPPRCTAQCLPSDAGGLACVCSSTCAGHDYVMDCRANGCSCSIDGVPQTRQPVDASCSPNILQASYGCAFPIVITNN